MSDKNLSHRLRCNFSLNLYIAVYSDKGNMPFILFIIIIIRYFDIYSNNSYQGCLLGRAHLHFSVC